jgi:hypothetical protein
MMASGSYPAVSGDSERIMGDLVLLHLVQDKFTTGRREDGKLIPVQRD